MKKTLPPPRLASPPVIHAYLRDTVQALLDESAAKKVSTTQAREQDADRAAQGRRIHTDYKALICEWFQSIPPAARQRRYTTEELLIKFAGRYRDRPAIRMIGAALRANGFTPRRDWTAAGRNSRYWEPPQGPTAKEKSQ